MLLTHYDALTHCIDLKRNIELAHQVKRNSDPVHRVNRKIDPAHQVKRNIDPAHWQFWQSHPRLDGLRPLMRQGEGSEQYHAIP